MREAVFTVFAAVLGGIIGSFLNACIHRMPRNIPLGNPKRSFCPSCQRTIPWYENLPLISWLMLRGRCSGCGAKISARYFVVELITALAFLAVWLVYGFPLGPVYWVLLALLIAATFIDIEHFIIPDEITWGGTAAGVLLCLAVPEMMQTPSRLLALGLSVASAALGYGMLWFIVEFGKLAFGKKRHKFPEPEPFSVGQEGETVMLAVGEEKLPWEEIFSWRDSDELVLDCQEAAYGGETHRDTVLRFRHNRLIVGETVTPLENLADVRGKLKAITIPREAMGFGDVKFIACIGAFLGWRAVLFTIASAAIIGCVAALGGVFLAKDKAGTRLPFGPFLALGAVIWIFAGEQIWVWYLTRSALLIQPDVQF